MIRVRQAVKRLIYLSAVFTIAMAFSGCAVTPEPYEPNRPLPVGYRDKKIKADKKAAKLQSYSEFMEENEPAREVQGEWPDE